MEKNKVGQESGGYSGIITNLLKVCSNSSKNIDRSFHIQFRATKYQLGVFRIENRKLPVNSVLKIEHS